ncbi:LacI family transcriptional regulator [Paraflavitalea soli]|uniref:LacI family transcriptional regulator n=1 Tax=Paraflavitalea soli TaxID=2315862 RepID=A0A3B7MEW2_9BACT|nr:substrate-binding domain-containing protein [Paraflavitalea soli]AXY72874.1 LacI family transcriptional regulator [Paraflavitalea soli]
MERKVSLKDIAQKVGVSTALVSYVLNNKRENRVSKELARRIRETAAEMNYRTNQVARSLKTNKTYTIGLIVADIANSFSSGLARIIEDEAEQHQYTVIYSSNDENAHKCGKLIDTLLDRKVDGLIIAPPAFSEHQLIYLQQQRVPFVLVDRYFPDLPTNYVALDNYGMAFKGIEHLIQVGCRRIGMITYKTELHHLQERRRGYTAALKKHRLPVSKKLVREVDIKLETTAIENAIDSLLSGEEPVDGLLFSANNIALAGLKYISTLPVKVPDQLAIVSFDETEALEFFYAPFAYIKQPLPEMGRLATHLLLESIEKGSATTQVNLEGELILKKPYAPR